MTGEWMFTYMYGSFKKKHFYSKYSFAFFFVHENKQNVPKLDFIFLFSFNNVVCIIKQLLTENINANNKSTYQKKTSNAACDVFLTEPLNFLRNQVFGLWFPERAF